MCTIALLYLGMYLVSIIVTLFLSEGPGVLFVAMDTIERHVFNNDYSGQQWATDFC